MPDYPHLKRYREELARLRQYGGSTNELSMRRAFETCLDDYCRAHPDGLALIAEQRTSANVQPDGTVRDALRLARGYWEAKDTADDLDAEIEKKLIRGYPRNNIIFEDSQTAVLIQNSAEAMRVDMSLGNELHQLIKSFLEYEPPQIEEFRKAQHQFKTDLPSVLTGLRETIEGAENGNLEYQTAARSFLSLCRETISPEVSSDNVREMLLQHILTKDIFLRVFAEDQFHRENNIARHLDELESAFFTGDTRRASIDRLRSYYGAIGRAADEIADYAEKQQFLKVIYEDFYKAYNPAAADQLGIVYTPNEVVDFIIRSTDFLLQRHFRRSLADDNVQILDPATGTGTFITNLINYLPKEQLEHKYRNEIHANEVAILPYYIANLNIEYTYKGRTGEYCEFPNLVFVDTLDNLDWKGATEGAVQRQGSLEIGGISVDNWVRLQEQNEKPISVIIGNPPYNANQRNWNELNPNRTYPQIDQRIKETYVAESKAQKTKQYDMYKRFIRWASDRLADDGIIAFITNRAYIDAHQDDGFRRVAAREFSELYIVDLGGDIRKSGQVGNIFGIMTGVAVGFFVRRSTSQQVGKIHYYTLDDALSGAEKLSELRKTSIGSIVFEEITPDRKNDWLNQSDTDFETLIPVADKKRSRAKKALENRRTIFSLCALGVSTNRDEWVYDFDVRNLRNKALFFADTYNERMSSTPPPPFHSYQMESRFTE